MNLRERLEGSPYQGYTYSYPHKTAYRPLDPPVSLDKVWAREDRSTLFLYLHIPFCQMRCGFCNLFTTARPEASLPARYLRQLRVQAEVTRDWLDGAKFSRLAVGGGTPTHLTLNELHELFRIVVEVMGCSPAAVPTSVEMSPETVDRDKLAFLSELGVERASIGVQSFLETETRALRRPQERRVAMAAVELMREAGFPVINIDLIYGIPGQTVSTWRRSLMSALSFEPEELYLYPLYMRPLTGLGNKSRSWEDHRLELYRTGREILLEQGYRQISMRMFRKGEQPEGPPYSCQQDGMIGLGAGARSYSKNLHYSTDWAVGRPGVSQILHAYLERSASSFERADYGITLSPEDQELRFLILSLLSHEGLDHTEYERCFRRDPKELPQVAELVNLGLAYSGGGRTVLTVLGTERADTIGPWLYSDSVRSRMKEFELR